MQTDVRSVRAPEESARAFVYRVLSTYIKEMFLHPGEKLAETDVAAELQVSRTPVHDTFSRLEREKMLRPVPRGAVVPPLNTDMIRQTLDEIDRDAFQGAVDALTGAHRIYILGVRSSSALANFLGFYFNLLFDNVTLVHTNSVSEIFEQVLRVGPGDVLFGISFPRYSKRTLSAMQYARDRGAKVIALTDSQLSPLARVADHLLLARSDMASFVDSLVAPLSVINALIVAVGMSRRDEIEHTFNKLESIWEKYDVYEKPEDDTN